MVGKTGRKSAERVKLKIQEMVKTRCTGARNDAFDDIHKLAREDWG